MKIPSRIYTVYAIAVFILLCLFYVPVLVILCHKKNWHHLALRFHTIWAWNYFMLTFIRVKIKGKFRPETGKRYIFCANHFSYLDIPSMLLICQAKFIGKNSLSRIPLFGYFYRKIHITVNRNSLKSRADSLQKIKEAIGENFNVVFFPEGGVVVAEEHIPQMVPFKNGAFILSVEKNIPIIPVTLPFNYRIVPDKHPVRLHLLPCEITIHEPVFPKDNSTEEVTRLKNEVFEIIQSELNAHHKANPNTVV